MGNVVTSDSDRIVSTVANDYNPFNIPSIDLVSPDQFNGSIAFQGCPPPFTGTKSQFANLSIEIKAAYADGVIRGSYQRTWIINDITKNTGTNVLTHANDSAIGALAYIYLKTKNQKCLDALTKWNEMNYSNSNKF